MKVIILVMLVAVLAALGGAGAMMLRKGRTPGTRNLGMARALALRVALSIALFLFILLAWSLGWIHPTGIPLSP
jgi:Protein of unknown function (DUF2909)